MADTVQGVITSALRKIGAIPEEQDVPSYMIQRGLEMINDIIDEWSDSRIYIPYQDEVSLQLLTFQERYTIGPDPSFYLNDREIMMVLQMNIFDPDAPSVAYPTLPPMTETVYSNIPYRSSTGIPVQYLLRNHSAVIDYSELIFQPLPYKPLTANIVCKKRLSRVGLTDTLTQLPRQYTRGLKFKLSMDLADIYGKNLSPKFIANATDALAELEAMSIDIDYMTRRDEQINRKNIVYFNWWL